MSEAEKFRIRANAKQTSNDGIFKVDYTLELFNNEVFETVTNPEDIADVQKKNIAIALWDGVEDILDEGTRRGFKVIDSRPTDEDKFKAERHDGFSD